MKLVRENKVKHRAVYLMDNGHYLKHWYQREFSWVVEHVALLNDFVPNYVCDYGHADNLVWIEYFPVPGVPANTFQHTAAFIQRIHTFCLNNIQETAPYVHGDWTLSNMLIDGDTIRMCDWDNLGVYPMDEVRQKLHSDLTSAFGAAFQQSVLL